MGLYVNPTDRTKENWLVKYGTRITGKDAVDNFDSNKANGKVPVCLVDNRIFSAAAVGYSVQETQEFATPDGRTKIWFLVSISDFANNSGITEQELKSFRLV